MGEIAHLQPRVWVIVYAETGEPAHDEFFCHFQKTTAPVLGAGPTGVQPTSERAVSAVLCTKYRKGPELLRTPLHDAALLCGRIVTTM